MQFQCQILRAMEDGNNLKKMVMNIFSLHTVYKSRLWIFRIILLNSFRFPISVTFVLLWTEDFSVPSVRIKQQSPYRLVTGPRGLQEVQTPRFRDNRHNWPQSHITSMKNSNDPLGNRTRRPSGLQRSASTNCAIARTWITFSLLEYLWTF